MKIKDVAFVAYPSDDVAGSRAWYENVLGLFAVESERR
jgi:hypothetical protein